ncbi:SDR family NAD(P)-dependent oxidoreductase, partial [Streptomyces zhihengii]
MSDAYTGRRVAVVTGADSGIGRASAVRLAALGMDVGLTFHSDERGAEETAHEVGRHGGQAVVEHCDLTVLPDAADVVDVFARELGRVDVLVNNAGTGTATPFLDLELATVQRVLDVEGLFCVGLDAYRASGLPRASSRSSAAGQRAPI